MEQGETMRLLEKQKGSPEMMVFMDALRTAQKNGSRLMPNRAFRSFLESGELLPRKPYWTGTIAVHPAKGKPFRKHVECFDEDTGKKFIMDTKRFRGLENVVLILESENCTILEKEGFNVIIPKDVMVIWSFPQESSPTDQFEVHEGSGMPVMNGGTVENGVTLWRNDKATIAPVVRLVDGNSTPSIWIKHGMSGEFGVLLEPIASTSS
jgi:hypothetical protein